MFFTNPIDFIGAPDWRSFVLAAIFTLPWLIVMAKGWLRSRWLWLAVIVSAILFPFTIAWIQVPLQQAINVFLSSSLSEETISNYILLLSIPSLLIASIIQEGFKLLVAIALLRVSNLAINSRSGLAYGAAAGAGYGGFEAFWVFNLIFSAGFSLATIQLGGIAALLGFVERFFAVPFHIGSSALAAYGYVTGRPWRFFALAVGLHTVANFAVVMIQAGLLDILAVEVWVAVVSLITIGAAIWLRWRGTHGPSSMEESQEPSDNGDSQGPSNNEEL